MSKKENITEQVQLDQTRHRRFTSSRMAELMSDNRGGTAPGQPFFTYVDEIYYQHLMDRDTELKPYSRAMAWGEYVERFAFEQLGLAWTLDSKKTYTHPDKDLAKWWSGRPDTIKGKAPRRVVGDIKCPEPKNFARYSDFFLQPGTEQEKVDEMKKDKDLKKFYWQLTSNAILTGAASCQLVVYMPTLEQLEEIQAAAWNIDEDTLPAGRYIWDYRFIAESQPIHLPHLPHGSLLKPLNSFNFTPAQEDVDRLTDRITLAKAQVEARLKKFMQ